MNMFLSFRSAMTSLLRRRQQRKQAKNIVTAIHDAIMQQSLRPEFYGDSSVRDDFFGRFGVTVLHAALVMRRLRGDGEHGIDLAQALFDRMFADFDDALRASGVGDLGVGKRIRRLGQAFYGAAMAYEEALSKPEPATALTDALARNLGLSAAAAACMADYVCQAASMLAGQEKISSGRLGWPEPPSFAVILPNRRE